MSPTWAKIYFFKIQISYFENKILVLAHKNRKLKEEKIIFPWFSTKNLWAFILTLHPKYDLISPRFRTNSNHETISARIVGKYEFQHRQFEETKTDSSIKSSNVLADAFGTKGTFTSKSKSSILRQQLEKHKKKQQ